MVGYNSPKFGKPDRSEELGPPEEREEHSRKVRAYLDANAPKRILKPSRSDAEPELLPSSSLPNSNDDPSGNNLDPPERMKYLQLLAEGIPLETLGSGDHVEEEDYTESEYYQYMAAIDKEHYTTGTGFIKVDNSTPLQEFHLSVKSLQSRSFRSNPAMNDWDPADRKESLVVSNKPLRSESASSDQL